jgi:hypothetical protein
METKQRYNPTIKKGNGAALHGRSFVSALFCPYSSCDTLPGAYIPPGYFSLLHVIDFIDLSCALKGDSFL